MARLQKFSGTQALPGVGSPQVVADMAVGSATADLGPQIARSFADLGELTKAALTHKASKKELAVRERHAARAEDLIKRKNDFAGKKAAEALGVEVRGKLAERRSSPSEALVPLADEMVTFMQSNGDKIWNALPEAQKPSFDTATKLEEDQLRTEIATAESSEDTRYFLDGIKQTIDIAVETVSLQPNRIDQVFEQVLDLVDTAALPGHLKEQSIQDAGREILEAWVQAHPHETQIAELSKLQAQEPNEAVSDPTRANANGTGNEGQTEFATRAGALPEASRNRLLATALKQRTETALVEQARIAERIDIVPEQVDPWEIAGNALLENRARLQLLSRFREAVDAHSRSVSALDPLEDSGSSASRPKGDQGLLSDAFSHLNDGKIDAAIFTRGIAVSTSSLQGTAGKILIRALASEDSEEVAQAFTTLSLLKPYSERADLQGTEEAQIRMLQAGESFLAKEHGLSLQAVSALFAKANRATTRKERLENFAALHTGKRFAHIAAFPMLG